MLFEYSDVLDSEVSPTGGLCGDIPVRRHRSHALEDAGIARAQEDWSRFVGPIQHYNGGIASPFSLMQVCVPECLPDRLEIVAYANEFAFLYDDLTEAMPADELAHENDKMLRAFMTELPEEEAPKSGLAIIQSKLIQQMRSIDHTRTIVAAKSWAKFLAHAAGRQHDTRFETYDRYMDYRKLDVGEMFWYGIVTWGMGLSIPESETDLCHDVSQPAWIALALQNDILSYEKELMAARRRGQIHVTNALWVLMEEQACSLDQARAICKDKIQCLVHDFEMAVMRIQTDTTVSADLKSYLCSLRFALSGNAAWSLICPRYNDSAWPNSLQLAKMGHDNNHLTTVLPSSPEFMRAEKL
ncbi:MAG: hypothetical protein M1828_005118 [Chrysothrix sp. TS-e1954]|nr:MAG: hypothetical protein M1828_005118 [Chrysothrix sp. TS-e1954]